MEPGPKKAFIDLVLQEAEEIDWIESAARHEHAEFSLSVTTSDGSTHTLYLGNIYADLEDVGGNERREKVAHFLRSASTQEATPTGWSNVSENLVPVIRSPGFGAEVPHDLVSRSILPFLREYLVIDREEAMSYVTTETFADWGITEVEAFSTARRVLASCTDLDAHAAPFDTDAPFPIWHYAWEDTYESSRLLLPEVLEWFRDKVRGNPIAVVPTRSHLVVTGDADVDAIHRLSIYADREYSASARRISPSIYTVTNGRVVPFETPEGHPHRALVHVLHLKLAAVEYDEQGQRMDEEFERSGTDIFVAKYDVVQFDDGRLPVSYCVWPENVDSLLPEADLVVLCGGEGENQWRLFVPWQRVLDVAGRCLQRADGFDPTRWRTCAWPSEDTLAELRRVAVDI